MKALLPHGVLQQYHRMLVDRNPCLNESPCDIEPLYICKSSDDGDFHDKAMKGKENDATGRKNG